MRVVPYLGLLAASPAQGFVYPTSGITSRSRFNHPLDSRSSFLFRHEKGILLGYRSPRQGARSLHMDEQSGGIAKTAAVVLVIGTTLGASVVPFFMQGSKDSGPQTVRVVDEDGKETYRGSMTSMARSEIQTKLSQVPVFFLRNENGGVHLEGGEGLFFMSPDDAQAKLAELKDVKGTKVAATTLDDVWFPLVTKKGLNKKPLAAQASAFSDPSARYRIVPRASQFEQAAQAPGWSKVKDKEGVPVWAASKLAFQASGSYKVPLFMNLDDLMTSWARLKPQEGSESEAPVIQVSSIGDVVDLMENGGGQSRKLEFFADMDAITRAEKLSSF